MLVASDTDLIYKDPTRELCSRPLWGVGVRYRSQFIQQMSWHLLLASSKPVQVGYVQVPIITPPASWTVENSTLGLV